MDESQATPLRVLVKGCSTAILTSWMGGPRTDFAYPRVVEAELLAAGIAAEVRVTADVGAQARNARTSWEREVITWSPDVVVLHYGQYEAIHLFIPWRLERYVNDVTRRPSPRPGRGVPAFAACPPTWNDSSAGFATSPGRWCSSPIRVPPGALWARPFPGMAARVDEMNAMLSQLVENIGDPDVRLFSVNDVIAAMQLDDDPTPDGGHFSPSVHREVGRALAGVIKQWAAERPHLLPVLPAEWPA